MTRATGAHSGTGSRKDRKMRGENEIILGEDAIHQAIETYLKDEIDFARGGRHRVVAVSVRRRPPLRIVVRIKQVKK